MNAVTWKLINNLTLIQALTNGLHEHSAPDIARAVANDLIRESAAELLRIERMSGANELEIANQCEFFGLNTDLSLIKR